MKLKDFISVMDEIAPPSLALDYDNPGLIVGCERQDIRRVLVALDCSTAVVEEAHIKRCDLVLSHHPLLFKPIKRILPDDPPTSSVYRLISYGIGLFAAHTNLDCAEGGVNTTLCRLLGIENERAVPPDNLLRIGELKQDMSFLQLAQSVEKVLSTRVLVAGADKLVKRVCVCGGSGGSEYYMAKQAGADVLITGECKHNQAIEAESIGLNIIVGGHYETECVVLKPLIENLMKRTSDVEYLLSEAETSSLKPLL